MAKTCFQRFSKITKVTQFNAAICGANILDPNYKPTFLTGLVLTTIISYFACTIYTIYIGLAVDGDWKILLQTLSVVGSAIQGLSKILSGIFKSAIFRSTFGTLDKIYIEYETDEEYLPVLRYRLDLTTKILKLFVWIYIITTLGITLYPLIYGPLHGERLHVIHFLLPGLNPETEIGYWIYVVLHSSCVYMAGFGNFAADMFLFISITHIPLLKDIMKIKCEKMNRVIRDTGDTKKTMPLIKELVQFHQGYITLIQEIEQTYNVIIFVQVSTSVMSICCTIFSILIKTWPAAFIYLMYSSIVLLIYCGLGNLVDISNDDITELIYVDLLWYELSISEQKLVLLMLRKSQTPISLTVGQIMPLSMNTAVQLAKAIYSYMMMLANFLETDDI